MIPAIALFVALLVPQAPTPATPPTSDSPAAQSAPRPSDPSATPLRRVGGGVTPPRVIYQVEPQFTKEARKNKVSGITLVNLIVDANGNPQNIHVLRSMADTLDKKHHDAKHLAAAQTLDQAAIDAVKKYKFSPAMEGGKPVPVFINVEVNFQIF